MKLPPHLGSRAITLALAWLVLDFAPSVVAQNAPRIGYVFPAGGRQGTTFDLVVGGQFLEGATNVVFTGGGVRGVVVDFHKPMNQGVFTKLRDRLKELQEKRSSALKSNRRGGGASAAANAWTTADEKEMAEIREKILKNPPNRNATPAIAEVATVRLTVDRDAALGDREIRLGTAGALSNPLKFQVGSLREFSRAPAKAANPDLERLRERFTRGAGPIVDTNEMRVTLPAVVNGQIQPGVVDRYRFAARTGQQMVISVSARELIPYIADAVPGWFQSAITLYDAKGREVAYNDDFRFRPDPVLSCTIPANGDYVLEIKDAIYRGREDFVYRITIGELPFVTGIYPLGGPAGESTEVELTGWNLPTNRVTFDAGSLPAGIHRLKPPADNAINSAVFAVDGFPETTEQEPNDSKSAAQRVRPPVFVNGRIEKPGDADCFQFTGEAGQTLVAEVMARRLDSPLDSALLLTDASGQRIAFNDDAEDKGSGLNTHHADARLFVTLPADGDYCLRLTDTQGKGSPAHAYRLRISPPQPDFALRLAPSALNLRGAASAPLTVYALRRDGFTSEIRLALTEAPEGFTLNGGKIPAGQDQVRATLTGSALAEADHFPLRMEGRAVIGGKTVVRPVVPADDLMQAFFYHHLVPAQELQVCVSGRAAGRGLVRVLSPTPVVIPVGGTARVRIGIPRSPLAERLDFALSDPPEGISIKQVTPNATGLEIVLESDANKAKAGVKGNLIFTASAGRANKAAKAATGGRGFQLGALPAVPFEISQAATGSASPPPGTAR